ncbi:MAG: hypothetical protein QM800_02265 [Paludibacter sp.]
MELISILLLVFPLLGFLATGLFQKQMNRNLSGTLASAAIFINLVFSAILFGQVSSTNSTLEIPLFDWIRFADILNSLCTNHRSFIGADAFDYKWCRVTDSYLLNRVHERR